MNGARRLHREVVKGTEETLKYSFDVYVFMPVSMSAWGPHEFYGVGQQLTKVFKSYLSSDHLYFSCILIFSFLWFIITVRFFC